MKAKYIAFLLVLSMLLMAVSGMAQTKITTPYQYNWLYVKDSLKIPGGANLRWNSSILQVRDPATGNWNNVGGNAGGTGSGSSEVIYYFPGYGLEMFGSTFSADTLVMTTRARLKQQVDSLLGLMLKKNDTAWLNTYLRALNAQNTGSLTFQNGLYKVGNTVNANYASAMWNAAMIQGRYVTAQAPLNGQTLMFDSLQNRYIWGYPDSLKMNLYYTKTEVDGLLGDTAAAIRADMLGGVDLSNYYNKTESDGRYLKILDTGTMLANYKHWLVGYLTKTAADGYYQPLGSYEVTSNKSSATTLGTSNTLYPTQNAVKTYVDNAVAAATTGVSSVFSRTGAVTAQSGDYNSDQVTEGSTNLFFNNTRVRAAQYRDTTDITQLNDSILVFKQPSIDRTDTIVFRGTNAVFSVFGRTGAITAQTGDYNSDQITEGSTNLFYTNARVRAALSLNFTTTGTSGPATGTYDNTTGQFNINIPQYSGGSGGGTSITYPYTTQKYLTGYGTFGSLADSARAALAQPTGQILYGTGTGTTSNSAFSYSGNIITLNKIDIDQTFSGFGLDYITLRSKTTGNGISANFTPNGTPSTNAYNMQFNTQGTNGSSLLIVGENTNKKHYIAVDNANSTTKYPLVLKTGTAGWSANADQMTLFATGNVSIGTTSDIARLGIKGSGSATSTNTLAVHNSTGTSNSLIVNDGGFSAFGTATPNSRVDVFGSFGAQIATFTTNTTLDIHQHTALCNAATASFTITLPTASTATRRIYIIKKIDASANTVTFTTTEGTQTLSTQWSGKMVQSDGTNWYIIGSF